MLQLWTSHNYIPTMMLSALCPRLGSSMFFTLPFPFLSFIESIGIGPMTSDSSLQSPKAEEGQEKAGLPV